jgi:hypothetical protein
MLRWRDGLFQRLRAHVARVQAHFPLLVNKFGVLFFNPAKSFDDAAPRVVAFTGKRQFCELFEPPLKAVRRHVSNPLTLTGR